MKIIGIIPARYDSSRFPGKPLAYICGKPMIWWVYNQAIKVGEFNDEVYVATDSKLIFDACEQNNIKVVMTSDKHQTGTDRLGEMAELIDADYYVNIQGDEPLIEPQSIERVIDYISNNQNVEIVNTMTRIQDQNDVFSDKVVKVVSTEKGDLLYLSRANIPYPKRSGEQVIYNKHLGLYGLSKKALKDFSKLNRSKNELVEDIEMLRFLDNGYHIKIIPVVSASIGVDIPDDIKKVEDKMHQMGIVY